MMKLFKGHIAARAFALLLAVTTVCGLVPETPFSMPVKAAEEYHLANWNYQSTSNPNGYSPDIEANVIYIDATEPRLPTDDILIINFKGNQTIIQTDPTITYNNVRFVAKAENISLNIKNLSVGITHSNPAMDDPGSVITFKSIGSPPDENGNKLNFAGKNTLKKINHNITAPAEKYTNYPVIYVSENTYGNKNGSIVFAESEAGGILDCQITTDNNDTSFAPAIGTPGMVAESASNQTAKSLPTGRMTFLSGTVNAAAIHGPAIGSGSVRTNHADSQSHSGDAEIVIKGGAINAHSEYSVAIGMGDSVNEQGGAWSFGSVRYTQSGGIVSARGIAGVGYGSIKGSVDKLTNGNGDKLADAYIRVFGGKLDANGSKTAIGNGERTENLPELPEISIHGGEVTALSLGVIRAANINVDETNRDVHTVIKAGAVIGLNKVEVSSGNIQLTSSALESSEFYKDTHKLFLFSGYMPSFDESIGTPGYRYTAVADSLGYVYLWLPKPSNLNRQTYRDWQPNNLNGNSALSDDDGNMYIDTDLIITGGVSERGTKLGLKQNTDKDGYIYFYEEQDNGGSADEPYITINVKELVEKKELFFNNDKTKATIRFPEGQLLKTNTTYFIKADLGVFKDQIDYFEYDEIHRVQWRIHTGSNKMPKPYTDRTILTPFNGASGVALNSKLTIAFEDEEFGKNIATKPGRYVNIHKYADDSLVESLSLENSDRVVLEDGKVTIYPVNNFEPETKYYILFDDFGIVNPVLNLRWEGISEKNDWAFTTKAYDELKIERTSPNGNDGDVDVPLNAPLVITFNNMPAQILRQSVGKNLYIYELSDDGKSSTLFATIPVRNPQNPLVNVSGSSATIKHNDFKKQTTYYVLIDDKAFISDDGLSATKAITSEHFWQFTTGENRALYHRELAPNVGPAVAVDTDLKIMFDEDVVVGDGFVSVYSTDGVLIEAIDVRSGKVSVTGRTVTLKHDNFPELQTFYVLADFDTVVSRLEPNVKYPGIKSNLIWKFATGKIKNDNPVRQLGILGSDKIDVPYKADSPNSVEFEYTANALYDGEKVIDPEILWSLDGPAPVGVSFSSDGKLTVDYHAQTGTVTIKAQWENVTATKTIAINRVAPVYSTDPRIVGATTIAIPQKGSFKNESYLMKKYDRDENDSIISDVTWLGATSSSPNGMSGVTASGLDSALVLTVNGEANSGSVITLSGITDGKRVSLDVYLYREVSRFDRIVITGPDTMTIPSEGGISRENYTAKAIDQFGEVMDGAFLWEYVSYDGNGTVDFDSYGWVSVHDDAAAGEKLVIRAKLESDPSKYADKEITFTATASAAASIAIKQGGTELNVPTAGNTEQYQYHATVKNQYGIEIGDTEKGYEGVTWSIEGSSPQGVVLDSDTGILYIYPSASNGALKIIAADGGVTDSKIVTIKRANSVLLSVVIESGPYTITAPLQGAVTEQFRIASYDQFGSVIDAAKTLEIVGTVEGASIINGNALLVTPQISVSTVKVRAKATYGAKTEYSDDWTVSILSAPLNNLVLNGRLSVTIPPSGTTTSPYNLKNNGAEQTADDWYILENVGGVSISDTGVLTVSSEAVDGTVITVVAVKNGTDYTKQVRLQYGTPALSAITISGETLIMIPTSAPAVKTPYTAVLRDQYGREMSGVKVWSIDGVTPSGVTLSSDGVLSVSETAVAASIKIKVTSGALEATLDVEIKDTSDTTAAKIEISGEDEIIVPALGENSARETYTAKITNARGSQLDGTVTWRVVGALPKGVSMTPNANEAVLTVAAAAQGGIVKLEASFEGVKQTKDVKITRAPSVPGSGGIEINGPGAIYVTSDLASNTAQYSAWVKDQYGDWYKPSYGDVTWTITNSPVNGVSVDSEGLVTVTKSASVPKFTLNAKVGEYTASKEVEIFNNAGGTIYEIQVTVTGEDGEPIYAALVEAAGEVDMTDEDGKASLYTPTARRYNVVASHEDYNIGVVSVTLREPVTQVNISLTKNGANGGTDKYCLIGTVERVQTAGGVIPAAAGEAIDGALVTVYGDGAKKEALTLADGTYIIAGLTKDAKAEIYFSAEGYKPSHVSKIIDRPQTEANAVLVKSPAPQTGTGSVTGIVIDGTTYQPIGGANVSISEDNKMTTADDGIYSFNNISAGEYYIIASAAQYNTNYVLASVETGKTVSKEIILSRTEANDKPGGAGTETTYAIIGKVTTQAGAAIVGATVSDGENSSRSDKNGRYILIGYENGEEAELTASATGYVSKTEKVAIEEDDVIKNFALDVDGGGGTTTYTVTYAATNGVLTDSATETVDAGGHPKNVPTVTANAGYTFKGKWSASTGGEFTEAEIKNNYIVNKNVTFTAVIEKNQPQTEKFTLIFDANGGTDAPSVLLVTKGTTVVLSGMTATPPSGKYFVGWSETQNGAIVTSVTVEADKTIYAIYEATTSGDKFDVTFDAGANGAFKTTNDPLASQQIEPGKKVENIPEITANSGYVFLGWQIDGDGAVFTDAVIKLIPVTDDVEYVAAYATASAQTYTLTFNAGDGMNAPAPLTIPSGTTVNVENYSATPKDNYKFIGWADEDNAVVTEVTVTKNITLTAQYAEIVPYGPWTVTFAVGANGVMNPASHTETGIIGGQKVTSVPTITANTNYSFLGWSKNGGTSYFSSTDILLMPITENITFTAAYQYTGGGGGGGGTPSTASLIVKGVYGEKVIYENKTTIGLGKQTISAPFVAGYKLAPGEASTQTVSIKSGNNTVTFKFVIDDNYNGPRVSDKIRELLEVDDHISYIGGYVDGSVMPDLAITRAEVATVFFRLLRSSAKNDSLDNRFGDVVENKWYTQAVKYLTKIGIIQGYPDGSFRPGNNITRAEFSAIASRFDDMIVGISNPFTDVDSSAWYYAYITSAYEKGWISGYPGDVFLPDNSITRAEAVTIVNKMLGRRIEKADIPSELSTLYNDLLTSHWAYAAIIEASVEHEYTWKENGYEKWDIWKRR